MTTASCGALDHCVALTVHHIVADDCWLPALSQSLFRCTAPHAHRTISFSFIPATPRNAGSAHGCTPSMAGLASFAVTLGLCSGDEELVVSTPVADQPMEE